MSVLFERGAFRVMCKYIEPKGNRWYYRRRIPADVQSLHRDPITNKSRTQLYHSLETANKTEAAKRADDYTRRLEASWKAHRENSSTVASHIVSLATIEHAGLRPGDGLKYKGHDRVEDFIDGLIGHYEPYEERPVVSAQDDLTVKILRGAPVPKTLNDAKEKHFALGKGPKGKIAVSQFDRAWKLLNKITGDIRMENVSRENANEFVDQLYRTGVGAPTIKRYLSQVTPVMETGIREFELTMNNPFLKLSIPNRNEGPRKPRDTYSMDELDTLQLKCIEIDDQRRWAILMLSDTMARLAEIAGLRKEDVLLDGDIPYILLRETEERRLKTKQSARRVPLVGEALWAVKRAMETKGNFLFPVFQPRDAARNFNASGASASLNKWLKDNKLADTGQGLHSFRHTMRDRLRNVEAPSDLIDRIGGWKSQGVGEGYGKGYDLSVMHKYMMKVVRPRFDTEADQGTPENG